MLEEGREQRYTSLSCLIVRRSLDSIFRIASGKVLTIGTRMGNCWANRMLFVMFAFASTNAGGLSSDMVVPKVSDCSRIDSLITSYEKQRAICIMVNAVWPPPC